MVARRRGVVAELLTTLLAILALLGASLVAAGCHSHAPTPVTTTGAGMASISTSAQPGTSPSATNSFFYPTLTAYGKDLFLSWTTGGSDNLHCLDKDAHERWSVSLGGYYPLEFSTSPDVSRAVVLATNSPAEPTVDLLFLVDEVSRAPEVTMLRDLQRGAYMAPEVRLSRDGSKVAMLLSPEDPSSGASAVAANVEIMDGTGNTLWQHALPEGRWVRSWAVDSQLRTVAVLLDSPVIDGTRKQAEQVRIFRDSPLLQTLDLAFAGSIDLSPDGQSLAVITSEMLASGPGKVELYTVGGDARPRWSASLPAWATSATFINDGTVLMVEGGIVFSGPRQTHLLFLSSSDGRMIWSPPSRSVVIGTFATSAYASKLAFWGVSDLGKAGVTMIDFGAPTPATKDLGADNGMLILSNDCTTALAIDDKGQIVPLHLP